MSNFPRRMGWSEESQPWKGLRGWERSVAFALWYGEFSLFSWIIWSLVRPIGLYKFADAS